MRCAHAARAVGGWSWPWRRLRVPRRNSARANGPYDPPGTFSILGFDPETGEIGAAVQSRVFSVGNGVLWAEAGVGAVATQAIVDVELRPAGPRAAAPEHGAEGHHQEDPGRRTDPGSNGSRGRRRAASSR